IVTEPIAELTNKLPVMRIPDECAYYKEDAGKLLLGAFEPGAKPWGMDGIPEDFCFDELPEDFDHFAPVLEAAMKRLPILESSGIRTFFNGPESFTPDDAYLLGEAPELKNFFMACGFNSIGIQSAGGAGKVLSEWIVEGHPPMDLWDVDVRRMMPFQGNKTYLRERVTETLGLLYDMHWPYRQYETARGARQSILHDRLASRGACFGTVAGWERPNWFAPKGVEPKYEYSYKRQNWFEYAKAEHMAVRENVGIFDMSSFSKFLVQGRDAETVLQRICANDVAVPVGRAVYTQWLNERGGIEADLTVTRLAEDRYQIVTAGASGVRDFDWLNRHIPDDAHAFATDISSGLVVLPVMGPNARALLQKITDADLSHEGFPFATAREIEIGYAKLLALRITYVGELGWELYIPTEFAPDVFDRIMAAGEEFGLKPCGMHVLDSCRIEKAFRHFGHDITDEDTPVEAGLMFACAMDKSIPFIGRDAIARQKDEGVPKKRMLQFLLQDPEPLLYHNEPILRDGEIVGRVTSGNYGHALGGAVGMGYVDCPDGVTKDYVESGKFEIEVAGERFAAKASLRPMYDPKAERVKQ
ncbi:MAG: FAD-dependent oxidoreductase, partial [Alphaproteobacteria bacterium]|nr:FAD-dependent oxidoreductase [Alphaproteobacteria bacterium]